MGSLAGLVALVTGCGRERGIGRAIAVELAAAGADVGVCDITQGGSVNADKPAASQDVGWGGLRAVAEEIEALGRRASVSVGDVGIKGDADRMVAETVAVLGRWTYW